ncbi:hypothetical protein CKAH01_03166 [Colletotrichum kahawae]|uniref:Uncharacterized protein n=1 Tax=Colletotrichum kahawae TaxID=34407 RepID=A0AAD9YWW2_COLKA|nr:hypothetical protein CKAH01_03166 [Colletotrichum kahawae]
MSTTTTAATSAARSNDIPRPRPQQVDGINIEIVSNSDQASIQHTMVAEDGTRWLVAAIAVAAEQRRRQQDQQRG